MSQLNPSTARRANLAAFVIVLCVLAGCTSIDRHATDSAYSNAPLSVSPAMRNDVVIMALAQLGTRYAYGGMAPTTGFDCSGLVDYVFETATKAELPRTTSQIASVSRPIPKHELAPGDLVFFNTLHQQYSHVGIYMGNGRFINAPSSGGVVRIDSLQKPYYAKRFDGARTLFAH